MLFVSAEEPAFTAKGFIYEGDVFRCDWNQKHSQRTRAVKANRRPIQSHHQQRQFSVNYSVGILGAYLTGRHIFR
jgi:hypothetical protein